MIRPSFAILSLLALSFLANITQGQGIPAHAQKSELSTYFLPPTRIVWTSEHGVENAETLLKPSPGQTTLSPPHPAVVLIPGENSGSILLDFGTQISGYLELFGPGRGKSIKKKVRLRFGESVSETMAELGERGAQNDHALRDQIVTIPWYGKTMVGPSGFRFVRIDAVEGEAPVRLDEVRAVLQIRDIPYLGSFTSNDERLNEIWTTGAWTVHLNMQDYLWDGVKRDRLVWVGDMHPEVSIINAVFGHNDVVPKSLDLVRDTTPPTAWMNGISSYSLWWIILHDEWFQYHGNLEYLREQRDYLSVLLPRIAAMIDENGREKLEGERFLDWPTSTDPEAVHEGLQAMMVLSLQSGERIMNLLDEPALAQICADAVAKLRTYTPPPSGRKSPAALTSLAGLRDRHDAAAALKKDGPADLSTFYGFYVIEALGKAGETTAALDLIRQYWGGMLDVGATTFWEHFDLAWTENAGRIDELVPPGKIDIHGDFGAHSYIGFRHSLCHGWAGGPTAFLSHRVLGIQPAAPGFAQVRIHPDLGDLEWAEGTYPTPHGLIQVRHERQADGTIHSKVTLPPGVEQVP
jgi:alpha-L-rhamnosidase